MILTAVNLFLSHNVVIVMNTHSYVAAFISPFIHSIFTQHSSFYCYSLYYRKTSLFLLSLTHLLRQSLKYGSLVTMRFYFYFFGRKKNYNCWRDDVEEGMAWKNYNDLRGESIINVCRQNKKFYQTNESVCTTKRWRKNSSLVFDIKSNSLKTFSTHIAHFRALRPLHHQFERENGK